MPTVIGMRRHVQALDGAQHGNGRGDYPVAIEQCGAKEANEDHDLGNAGGVPGVAFGKGEREEGEDAAFAFVIGAEHEPKVFDRDEQDQRPKHEGENTKHIGRRGGDGVRPVEALAQGVKRTRADVTIDHAEGADRQAGQVSRTISRILRIHSSTEPRQKESLGNRGRIALSIAGEIS
jgi:hypothetical protein